MLTTLAVVAIWAALVMPNELSRLSIGGFVRIPLEALVVMLAVLVVPARVRRPVAAGFGMLVGILLVLKVLDVGFYEALDRPFNPVTDRGYFGPAVGVLGDSVGTGSARLAAIGAAALVVLLPVGFALAASRVGTVAASHRRTTVQVVVALGVVWGLCALTGAQLPGASSIASTSATTLAYGEVRDARLAIEDQHAFLEEAKVDDYRHTPGDQLLTALRGKDVIVAFVESYGRVALEDPRISPGVRDVLDAGNTTLGASGFGSRSAFLHSPTFGGISWLAHSTFQSGLWIDSQLRYDTLVTSDRFTMSQAFKRAGWRTVGDVPSNRRDWPEGKLFYDYDQTYDERNVGYQGPKFSYASMPDQYTLDAFRRLELAKSDRPPIFAEIDLVSSHTPWTPTPHLVDWSLVRDGSIYNAMPAQGPSPDDVWPDAAKVQAAYGTSIQYSLQSLLSFVHTYGDDNLVLLVLGDHQPATIVSGPNASHDVPISVIAHDPAVLQRIDGWGWQRGIDPSPDAPVWPMDAFRDKFLATFGSTSSPQN